MSKEKSYTAIVRVSLDIHVSGTWSEDTTMLQARKQALESAEQTLGNLIGEETNPSTQTAAARRVKAPKLMSIELAPTDGEVRS
jgi:prefoldin subunit 5